MEPLVVPHPIRLEYLRGAASLTATGRALAVRLHDDDIKQLHEIAAVLSIPPASIMRWLVVYGMKELFKQHLKREIVIRP